MNFDDRLRRLLGGLDTGAGFEARVMERIAGLATSAPREDLRAQFERRREVLRRRLLREAWMNGVTTMGIAACAGAVLWHFAPEIQSVDPNLLIGGTAAAICSALWLLVRRTQSRR